MLFSQDLAEVEQAALELVVCTRQPGRLRISKHACTLRHLLAQKGKPEFAKDEYGMARKAGLDICRDCPEGRAIARGRGRE